MVRVSSHFQHTFEAVVERFVQGRGLKADAGVAASVVSRAGIEFLAVQGLRDCASKVPLTDDTRFDVGSLTKSFTAASLLVAQKERLLQVDRPLIDQGAAIELSDPVSTRRLTIVDVLT